MSENPLVSIIVPAYNVDKYIKECIESIINQSYKNIEILVINDGSKDNTAKILDEMACLDDRIAIIHKTNAGVSSARNVGIENSKGDYLVFVDGDDYLSKDYVEYMLSLVYKTDADMGVSLDCYTRKDEGQVVKDYIDILNAEQATALLLSPRIIVGSWNKIYKKSILIENNLRFATNLFYGEGLVFFTTFSQLCEKIAVGKRKVYYYRRNNYDSVCTRFNINNFINGDLSIDTILDNLIIKTDKVVRMLELHKCLFSMGAIVRIKTFKKEKEYPEVYNRFRVYLKQNIHKFIFCKDIPIYRQCLLLGTCVSPAIMSKLDNMRRKKIALCSV